MLEIRVLWVISIFVSLCVKEITSDLVAFISQRGLHGEIHFKVDDENRNIVRIESKLETTLQYPNQVWSWGIYENPVDYTIVDPSTRCSLETAGRQIHEFDEELGYLILPGNETTVWEKEFNITGPKGLWGKSLSLLDLDSNYRACSSIVTMNEDFIAEAKFREGIAGSIYFRWFNSRRISSSNVLILSGLQKRGNKTSVNRFNNQHSWKIFVTDIFDTATHRIEENCNILQIVFDPQNYGTGKSIGDIDLRVGKLKIGSDANKKEYQTFEDDKFILFPADLTTSSRKLYVVIHDVKNPNKFIACAKIRIAEPRITKAFIKRDNVDGIITMTQNNRFEPTWLNFSVKMTSESTLEKVGFANDIAGYKIHELPPLTINEGCETSTIVYNPMNLQVDRIPPAGLGTQDQYMIGDLSGKLKGRNRNEKHDYFLPADITQELDGIYWDLFLPLLGSSSVYHRGLFLNKFDRSNSSNVVEKIWSCSSISLYERNQVYQVQMETAQVLFRYPIAGKIIFRQPKEKSWEDTTILIEYLIHADGSNVNNTFGHRWGIHEGQPGSDYYSWQNRCISVGNTINYGDLSTRLGQISIAGGRKNGIKISRKLFTVENIALSGYKNVIGRSVTIFDDFGPVARGERLGCSRITRVHRRKSVGKDWFGIGGELSIQGKFEITQQSQYELTNMEIELKGLDNNHGFQVFTAPVERYLEFPCETLVGVWGSSKNKTSSRVRQTEIGDLSGKFGYFDDLKEVKESFNDTNLPLFGYKSILGRSIVINKREKNLKAFCTTLERGYSANEAREIRAIASFHHPAGFAYGYIRMSQLIGSDHSQSETTIEVNLRHPGENDRNLTRNHNWQIFVNPIGVDAAVKTTATRCVAGGYVWNPYYTQLADPLNTELYREECAPDNPLRCYVGDLSSRLGTINLGYERVVLSDTNFPLEGDVTAVGRSIVIFGPEYSNERYACANIEPDHDIVRYINIERPPRFVINQFLNEIRSVMNLPKWMLEIDSRTTKILHGGACIQMVMHFRGPQAHKFELDFSRLLTSGRLDEPSLYIPGYINPKRKKKLAYRTCSVRDPKDKNKKSSASRLSQNLYSFQMLTMILVIRILY